LSAPVIGAREIGGTRMRLQHVVADDHVETPRLVEVDRPRQAVRFPGTGGRDEPHGVARTERGGAEVGVAYRVGAHAWIRSMVGAASRSLRVYGCCGSSSTCSVGPRSMISPSTITATVSAMFQARPRS